MGSDSATEGATNIQRPPAPVSVTSPGRDRPAAIENLGWALALVVAAQFVLQLDFSIVNVALPTIEQQLHFSPADLQWIVTGYALTFGSLLLFGGRLGDVVGRRKLLIIGLVLFALTSLSAGLAQSSLALIVSRFAQGAAAAMVAPMALASVTDLYAEGPARVRALGIFQGATAAGASTGIVLGGILTQYVGWRAIFLVNPPIIAVLIFAMIRVLPRQGRRGTAPRLDIPGAVLATVSIGSLIFGLSEGQQRGFAAPLTLAALTLAVVLGVAFVVAQRRSRAPMDHHESHAKHDREGECGECQRGGEAALLTFAQTEDQATDGDRGQYGARDVEAWGCSTAVVTGQDADHREDQDGDDRRVDEKNRPPSDVLGQDPAKHDTGGGACRGCTLENAKGAHPCRAFSVQISDRGQRHRSNHGGARTLGEARNDQRE